MKKEILKSEEERRKESEERDRIDYEFDVLIDKARALKGLEPLLPDRVEEKRKQELPDCPSCGEPGLEIVYDKDRGLRCMSCGKTVVDYNKLVLPRGR